jgi:hypothetical protein
MPSSPKLPQAFAERSPRRLGHHSPAGRAARSVSDAAVGIANVLIIGEAERAEAERLVGAHRASVKDKVPLAGRLTPPVIVGSGVEAGDSFATYAG